uniref:Elongation factor-like 1 n=1 Tax=Hirondellea gigas TaxID=1518452 RepID=A0A2P2I1I5_9CRUS
MLWNHCNRNNNNKAGDVVRNICIMAHVDHGKTTLADALIATNGIISQSQAGSIRYMDSRKDEMERGITMKSSCITLAYSHQDKSFLVNLVDSPGHVDFSSEVSTAVRLCDGCILVVDVVEGVCAQTKAVMRQAWSAAVKPVLVLNKLDRLVLEKKLSPLDAYYHIAHVLEQVNAYMAELHNTDVLGRSSRPRKTSSSINSTEADKSNSTGTARDETLNKSASNTTENSSSVKEGYSQLLDWAIEDVDDSHIYFNPTVGNVVFASAIDGWGFSTSHFAEQFSRKLGMSYTALSETLWGDYYISKKNGGQQRIMRGARDKRKSPLFVSLILENLYTLYKKVRPATADVEDVKKIVHSLGVKLPQRLLETATESKARFRHVCSSWLPLSQAVLGMVVQQLPAPTGLSVERAKKLLTTATRDYTALPQLTKDLLPHLMSCSNQSTAPLIVYVSKMFGVSRKKLQDAQQRFERAQARAAGKAEVNMSNTEQEQISTEQQQRTTGQQQQEWEEGEEDVEELLAFARVFSGSLKRGMEVYVLGPKHDPSSVVPLLSADGQLSRDALRQCPYITTCKVGSVYLLLGREVKCLASAGAGLMIGIAGLTEHIIKSGSLSTLPVCPPFTHVIECFVGDPGLKMSGSDTTGPILRVQVMPKNPRCLGKLREGLKLLNQADPCVQVWLEKSGEYMIGAAGEVHLQRCLTDLEERYARTAVTASDPIVPFRETVVARPLVDQANEIIQGDNLHSNKQEDGDGSYTLNGALGVIRVRTLPLPEAVTRLLLQHSALLKTLSAQAGQLHSDKTIAAQVASLRGPSEAARDINNATEPEINRSNRDNTATENSKCNDSDQSLNKDSSTEINSLMNTSTAKNIINDSHDCLNTDNSTEMNSQMSTSTTNNSVNGSDDFLNSDNSRENNASGIGSTDLTQSVNSLNMDELGLNSSSDSWTKSTFTLGQETKAALSVLHKEIEEAFDSAGEEWTGAADQMWSVGPQYCGPNVLVNRIPGYERPSIWQTTAAQLPAHSPISAMDYGFVTGFQLCSAAGTLCEEPLMGVCFVVEDWQPPAALDALSPGKVIAVSKDMFLNALEEQPRRMMVATYSCVVSVTTDVVGRVYSVLGRRHGRILKGDITEGSTSWNVTAYLPVVESIDFANELRKATSGEAQPMLMFSHWETLDIDPYWDPTTAEELKHFGEKADTENLARQYMNAIRKRKGIKEYGKKLVEFGEKQRTLGKNK